MYLFDDPLSAVDAHVGQVIFDRLITGLLKDKARILVTHQLQCLPRVDKIIVMDQGKIQQVGTYKEIVEKGMDFAALVQEIHHEEQHNGDGNDNNNNNNDHDGDKRKGDLDVTLDANKDESKASIIEEEEHVTGTRLDLRFET